MKSVIAPIQFISGKGGVGKSILAAALAFRLSSKDKKKVLLVELGETSFYEKFFQIESVGYSPQELAPNLDIARWDFKSCLKEYVGFYIPTPRLFEIFFENKIMRTLIDAAPALKELAILGKATSGPRKVGPPIPYDCIIVDSYSTGHHKALLKGPVAMSQVIHRGPMGHHSEKIGKVISDPNVVSHFIVMKPEDLPTIEGLELTDYLESELGIKPQIWMNMVMERPLSKEQLQNISEKKNFKKIANYYENIFSTQEDCLELLKKKRKNYLEIPFCHEIEDKMSFLNKISESL